MLSIETAPTTGARRPPTTTSALFVSPRRYAVAVADRDRAQPRVALGDEAPPVAGALPRLAALDLGQVGAQLQRGLQPLLGRVALERVEAVDRDAAADHVQARGRLGAASPRSWRRARARRDATRARRRAHAVKRSNCSRRKPGSSSSAVAKCVKAPASRSAGAAATAATVREASAASRVPSRPMPVSSLTCTPASTPSSRRAARDGRDAASRQHATSAAARERDVELLGRQRPQHQQRALDACRAQLARPRPRSRPPATPAPPACAARAAGTAPWP